jgi:serine/threonine-protein phosphatase 2B catalytic subunit
LFLGDYVDRGEFGIEVMAYLLALKLKYPTEVYMLRGNHETEEMTQMFNFRTQALDRFDIEIYKDFLELFQALPIAAICNGKLLCVHGGISQRVTNVKTINKVDRFREPPEQGILTDLLWADPFDKPKDAQSKDYAKNDVRNISVVFGLRPAKELLKKEKLLSIVRAHQVKPNGYEFHNWEGNFPTVITIFSAPNYE